MKTAVHQYEDKLLEFAYGELPAHEASAVDAHVRGCARCTRALEEIRSVRSAMALPMEPAPDAGLDSLLAFAEVAAKRNAEAGKPVPFWKKYLTPLVLVATLVTVGVVATQANKEVDLSPAAAASDQTASEYSKREERKKADAPPSPPPVTAAAPQPEAKNELELRQQADLEANQKGGGEVDDRFAEELGTGGKRGSAGGLQSVTRRDLPGTKSAPVEKKPAPKVASKDVLATAPAQTGPAQDKTAAGGYGLTGGTMLDDSSNSGRAVRLQEAQPYRASADEAPAAPSAAPVELAKAEKKENASAPEKKRSMSVSSGSVGGVGLAAAEEESLSTLDSVGADGDAKLAERQRAATAATALEQARTAAKQGNRKGEVTYAAQAIDRGATGSARLEALTHLCSGYEALGQYDAADGWCDSLLREFPNSSAAQGLAQRRANTQQYRATPSKASKAKSQPADAVQAQ